MTLGDSSAALFPTRTALEALQWTRLFWLYPEFADCCRRTSCRCELSSSQSSGGQSSTPTTHRPLHGDREIEAADTAVLDEPGERGQRLAETVVGIGLGVVALGWRAERAFYRRVVVEKREENGDAFDDRSAQLGLNAPPVIVEPRLTAASCSWRSGSILSNPASLRASKAMAFSCTKRLAPSVALARYISTDWSKVKSNRLRIAAPTSWTGKFLE